MLDDLIAGDHVCRDRRILDHLKMDELGFGRTEAAETGRNGYDPRDQLKLYLYGYLHTIRSSRRLEAECRRNVEMMWLLGRLCPDHKSIAAFRRMHRDALTATGAQLVREQFHSLPETDTYLCPVSKIVRRTQLHRHDKAVIDRADAADCGCCSMKARCSQTAAGILTRLLDEDALNRMHQRATPQAMRLRGSTVELPFAVLKYRIFGHPRLLPRDIDGAQTEISLPGHGLQAQAHGEYPRRHETYRTTQPSPVHLHPKTKNAPRKEALYYSRKPRLS